MKLEKSNPIYIDQKPIQIDLSDKQYYLSIFLKFILTFSCLILMVLVSSH